MGDMKESSKEKVSFFIVCKTDMLKYQAIMYLLKCSWKIKGQYTVIKNYTLISHEMHLI